MALVLSLVKGVKNEQGEFVAPTEIQVSDIIKGQDADHVELDGLSAGDTVDAGTYFAGKFNVEENKFVSALVAVPAFNVDGEPVINGLHVDQADGKATIVAE